MNKFKQNVLIGATLLFSLPLAAQVTIERADFSKSDPFVDTVYRFAEQIPAPTEGEDQTWDYSNFDFDSEISVQPYEDASGDDNFPNASLKLRSMSALILPGVFKERYRYEGYDDDGFYILGRSFPTSDTASLEPLTTNPNDFVVFPSFHERYDNPITVLEFPVNYGDKFESNVVDLFIFEPHVQMFGLAGEQVQQLMYITEEREVVGWGSLTLPAVPGEDSGSMDVLMVKKESVTIDSFFFANGDAAPDNLLAPFNLEQGFTTINNDYIFYLPGFNLPVLAMGFDESNNIISAAARPRATRVRTPTSVELNNPINVAVFPNPIQSGEPLNLQLESEVIGNGNVLVTDMSGRQVYQEVLPSLSGQVQVQLPHLSSGLYLVNISNRNGDLQATKKIIIH